jgi:hypothetical protein
MASAVTSTTGRAAELVAQRVAEAGVDRPVFPSARARGASGDELAGRLEVVLEQLLADSQRRRQARRGRGKHIDVERRYARLSANPAILVEENQAGRRQKIKLDLAVRLVMVV